MLQFTNDNSLSISPKHSVNHLKNKASRARAFTNQQQEKLHYPFCLGQLKKSISLYQRGLDLTAF